ncbi:MAG: putative signal transduction histidine kinase [Ferruginibacter sp.]|nr:putative signal transduction histidine kinase [Ferruginibacter sp.]
MFNSAEAPFYILVVGCTVFIALLITVVIFVIKKYQLKQHAYFRDLEELKAAHQNNILKAQLEIQEQTFVNIAQEIHDNIGQKLTLAKLHLNVLNFEDSIKSRSKVHDSVSIIGDVIHDLSDLSRMLNSEKILNDGFIAALEFEVSEIQKPELYKISLAVHGDAEYFDSNSELLLFRIVQEALHNVIKHANANSIKICLNYEKELLVLKIIDNGKGFNYVDKVKGMGLKNMRNRATMLHGDFTLESNEGFGTQITIKIPYNHDKATA